MDPTLSALSLQPDYDKSEDDIAASFYLPCLRAARTYDRVTGYFSSAVYIIAWDAIRDFVRRGGRFRIVCSPALSTGDADALRTGYSALEDAELASQLAAELDEMLAHPELQEPTRAFAGLVGAGIVQLRVATLRTDAAPGVKRLVHDKVGLFSDASGAIVGFRGSMNETYLGLASDGNLESIDVFPSWVGGRDERRTRRAASRFERLWAGELPGVDVAALPDAVMERILETAGEEDWELVADRLAARVAKARSDADEPPSGETGEHEPEGAQQGRSGRQLRRHQALFIANWHAAGRRGIAEHATGSGKTFTAVSIILDCLAEGFVPVVVVPSDLLLQQWVGELSSVGLRVLRCGGGHTSWRSPVLRRWLMRSSQDDPRAVVAVINSASDPGFVTQVQRAEQVMLIVDECHRAGSREFSKIFQITAAARLGLSATPRRFGDPRGTDLIFNFFGGIVEPVVSLHDAIESGVLVRYRYHPRVVYLSESEQARWDDLSTQIRRRLGRLHGGGREGTFDPRRDEGLRKLLIARARVVKKAEAKVAAAAEIVAGSYQRGQRWLVYCEDGDQLGLIRAALAARGLESMEYFTRMEGDRSATLAEFELNGGVLVSIRCLDEGVDIPATSHALILASSRNPREFIQRRGRVLRRHKTKDIADVFDVLVLPPDVAPDEDPDGLVRGELGRAIEFGQWAENRSGTGALERICIDSGLDIRILSELGIEEDEDDDTH